MQILSGGPIIGWVKVEDTRESRSREKKNGVGTEVNTRIEMGTGIRDKEGGKTEVNARKEVGTELKRQVGNQGPERSWEARSHRASVKVKAYTRGRDKVFRHGSQGPDRKRGYTVPREIDIG